MTEASGRLDKWLWHARFFKTRGLATRLCGAGQLRLGGEVVSKAHHKVRPGDVLTFPQGRHIRVVRVLGLASRRGPAEEARQLYEDLKPPSTEGRVPAGPGPAKGARPTKRERRALERLLSKAEHG